MNRTEEIQCYLEMVDAPHLECDGSTRVFSWILREKGVSHVIKEGRLEYLDMDRDEPDVVEPHYWIELDTGEIVDFKARRWLPGRSGVPYGVFHPSDYPNALYVGTEANILVTRTVFEILTEVGS